MKSLSVCPLCRGNFSKTRNLALEQLIEMSRDVKEIPRERNNSTSKIKCKYESKGCKFILVEEEVVQHETECRYRQFECEGKKFCGWKCTWKGEYNEIQNHFKTSHKQRTFMNFKTEVSLKLDFNFDVRDVHLIDFMNGKCFFWYKHKISTKEQKAYWTFQLIGREILSHNFYYEFEIFKGPTRKLKVSEVCDNDTADTEEIFKKEKCVALSFQTLRNFLNEKNELSFKFRIMYVKKLGGDN